MNLEELFSEQFFQLPLKAHPYFLKHLKNTLDQYRELLESLDGGYKEFVSKLNPEISNSCDLILKIAQYYFEGKLLRAYELFNKLLEQLEQYLLQKDKNAIILGTDDRLFKARRKLEKGFEIGNMFHIPFEDRYHIKTNRFSLSGLPCLYLSNSIYTCWEELDRPFFSQMAVSRFETYKNFKYLDLSVDFWYVQHGANEKNRQEAGEKVNELLKESYYIRLEKFLQLFPLYAACYTKVYNTLADFKPEYIFPQMLMEWTADSDWVDGIIYESTKTERLRISGGWANLNDSLNFAIPVRSCLERGYCDVLGKNYKLTKPTSWEMVQILHPDTASKAINLKEHVIGKVKLPAFINFHLPNEESLQYHDTEFGRFEHYLMHQPLHQMPENNY